MNTMQISEAPVSYVDLWDAYMRLMDGKQSDAIFDWKEGDTRERRYLRYSFSETDHLVEYIPKRTCTGSGRNGTDREG